MNILLEMSLAGALLIVVVVMIRALVIHKLPKKTFLVLWAIVLLRLLVPVQVPAPTSIFNLLNRVSNETNATHYMPASDTISMVTQATLAVPTWQFAEKNIPINTTRLDTPAITTGMAASPLRPTISLLTLVYPAGIVLLTLYFIAIYVKHRKEFRTSIPVQNTYVQHWLEENRLIRPVSIRVSDKIDTPLTYGIIRPVILLPKSTNWSHINELEYILAHELVHIRRFDTLIKLVTVAALCIHWFNPIVWAMCFLFNRDMEISCDEAVINMFGETSKKGYALTLIGLAERGSHFPVLLHNNFSKHAIEERITAIMKIKKVTFIGTLVALLLVATTAVVFATTGTGDTGPATLPPSQASHQNDNANNNAIADATNSDNNMPTAAEQSTQSRFYIEVGEFFSGEPGTNDLTAKAAAQVGTDALKSLFGADVNGTTVIMHFNGPVEGGSGRGQDISWNLSLVNGWAEQLGMTVDEILDYVRESSDRNYTFEIGLNVDSLASVVGLTSDEFINGVMMIYIHERSMAVTEGWAYELGMTLDELFDYMMSREAYRDNGLEDFATTVGVELDQFIHVLGSVWNVAMTTWERHTQPSMWHGSIMLQNSYWSQFSFTVNAQTGAVIGAHYNPWATYTVGMNRPQPMMFSVIDGDGRPAQPTTQQNYEYSRLAMDIAQDVDILGSPIAKARISTLGSGMNPATGEQTWDITVEVRCVNGNTAKLTFCGFMESQATLTTVRVIEVPTRDSWGALEFEWVTM